jgi:lactate dehydrogenase-like 2-hydroxyacid dehydrogenase
VAALKRGKIGAAGLDVYEGEPKLNTELLKFENAVLTPHIASSSEATRRNMAMLAAQNLVVALTGATPPNLLNPGG